MTTRHQRGPLSSFTLSSATLLLLLAATANVAAAPTNQLQHHDDYHFNPRLYPSLPPPFCRWAPRDSALKRSADVAPSEANICPPGYLYSPPPSAAGSKRAAQPQGDLPDLKFPEPISPPRVCPPKVESPAVESPPASSAVAPASSAVAPASSAAAPSSATTPLTSVAPSPSLSSSAPAPPATPSTAVPTSATTSTTPTTPAVPPPSSNAAASSAASAPASSQVPPAVSAATNATAASPPISASSSAAQPSSVAPSTTSDAPIVKQTDPPPPKIRGVNLGGWLVVERWMQDAFWKARIPDNAVDEWTIAQQPNAQSILKEHWDTWITEDDIQQIAGLGLTHIRIPIGYWAFQKWPGDAKYPADPYIQGQVEYLNKALGWAKTHNLKVIIDLHGVPGSQNGWDHSGKLGPILWPKYQPFIDFSVGIIDQIAGNYTTPEYADTVQIINLLNEPIMIEPGMKEAIRNFTLRSYDAIRKHDPTNVWVAMDAPFWPSEYCCNFLLDGTRHKLLVDYHNYGSAFETGKEWANRTFADVTAKICSMGVDFKNNWPLPIFGGEWSLATPQYYDFHDIAWDVAMRKLFDLYTLTFETYGIGWTFWTWKVAFGGSWNFQDLVNSGTIPRDFSQHTYSLHDICPNQY